ncbi:MAG TPA: hypothetical protein VK593_01995, partial [Edaphobacter sp.]|nr:hypothetical protein [Edaphobacter sp.]
MVSSQMEARREWITCAADEAAVEQVMAALHCPRGIARFMVSRGFTDLPSVQAFFSPSLNDLIDPMLMLGMAAAV